MFALFLNSHRVSNSIVFKRQTCFNCVFLFSSNHGNQRQKGLNIMLPSKFMKAPFQPV